MTIEIKKTSQPRVEKSKTKASLFKPSIYSIIGLPKTKNPVMEAEIINKSNINIGARKLSGWLLSKIFWI